MVDTQEFERLLEALESEDVDGALQHLEKLNEENTVLKNLLTAYLSYEDKMYIKIKYDIDLGV